MTRILTAIVAIVLMGAPAASEGETLPVATGEWAPYVTESLDNRGFLVEILNEVFNLMEVDVEYRFYPWRRCYDSVTAGKVWAAFPYSRTEKRAEEVRFSDKLSLSVTKFFVFGEPKIERYESPERLKPYRVGGVIGYFYEETFNRLGLNVDYAAREVSALEKLMMGRTDLLPLNELVGWHLIRTQFPDRMSRFGVLDNPYSVDDLYLIVSKDYPDGMALLRRFNKALSVIKDRYIYRSILERFQAP